MSANKNTNFSALGQKIITREDRAENDYYATDPKAVKMLLGQEQFSSLIWEPACGEGHISKALQNAGYDVFSTDIIYRGYGAVEDFLTTNFILPIDYDIITNPPYTLTDDFVTHALDIVSDGHKVAMFLRLLFLEGKKRRKLFDKYPPQTVYVASSRLYCAKNGDFSQKCSSAMAFAWFVWQKGYQGKTIIKWIN